MRAYNLRQAIIGGLLAGLLAVAAVVTGGCGDSLIGPSTAASQSSATAPGTTGGQDGQPIKCSNPAFKPPCPVVVIRP